MTRLPLGGTYSFVTSLVALVLCGCTNNPYPAGDAARSIYYDTFVEEPKHLDPARSYSSSEYTFLHQIYEPVVQYHYLKRPYTLVPLTATSVPAAHLYDAAGNPLPDGASAARVARAVYEISIRPGIQYHDHPAFVLGPDGTYRWHLGPGAALPEVDHPNQLPELATRALRAADYAYQIKRLAHPLLTCPIYPLLTNYIEGFAEFHASLNREVARIRSRRRLGAGPLYNQEADERANPIYLDLRDYDLPGVQVIDELTFRITLSKKYPQFRYWLAMPFFAPIPWEVDRFYSQTAAVEQNLTLDRFPVGTGPFALAVNQPNYRMVLRRNRRFHPERYPDEGMPEDERDGLLEDGGERLPFLEEAVYVLEKENIPRWNKFLQGYYDATETQEREVSVDVFDQALQVRPDGTLELTPVFQQRRLRLLTTVSPTTMYYAFNMLDDVVGGYDEAARKLRQALSIALNQEEFIQIFLSGNGVAAQGPVPPGFFGHRSGRLGLNPVVYEWDDVLARLRRKPLDVARQLLAQAGYPQGRARDGRSLVLFFDTTVLRGDTKARLDWLRKQFAAIGVQLQVRLSDYNRFQEKVRNGNFQLMRWGWHADYPDPENFFFLLYGPNGKVAAQGENAANYDNPRFNGLFRQMENMANTPQRDALIQEMLAIVREDAPWIWGVHPADYGLYHAWTRNAKPMAFGASPLKYIRIEPGARQASRLAWNQPVTYPVWIALGLLALLALPATLFVCRRGRRP